MDKPSFKRRVRSLKELGLTESLEIGYRLSPRGRRFRRDDAGPFGQRTDAQAAAGDGGIAPCDPCDRQPSRR